MKRLLFSLALAALLQPVSAGAQVLQGLAIDHPDLRDVYVGCPACSNTAIPGSHVDIKGAANGNAVGDVQGRFQGGVVQAQPRVNFFINSVYPHPSRTGWDSSEVPGTLAPPFASGALFLLTATSPRSGPFLQALLYEPDQVKRKTSAKQSSITLKQKGSVAIRQGHASSSYNGTSVTTTKIPDCKAQATIKFAEADFTATYKMKLRCSGKSAEVADLKQDLAQYFGGKAKNGFDLSGETD
jgi:hypothetical protein